MSFTIEAIDQPTDGHRDAILKPLIAYNTAQAGQSAYTERGFVVRDASGEIGGGLFAKIIYDWMFVELLVVPEALRGRGVGAGLLRQAEDTALAAGCVGVWLDTFSFQARPFYEKLGYELFGTLTDHPRGAARYFMRKYLAPRV